MAEIQKSGGGLVVDKGRSTPEKLRVFWLAAVFGAVVVSVVVNISINDRSATTERIATDQVSVIIGAQKVQTSVAEADAAAANEFLADGRQEQEQRAHYQTSIEEAGSALADVAAGVGDDEDLLKQVKSVEVALVNYSGLVESARANNRQNYPIGAAYLATASKVLDQDIYPATDEIANTRARQYRRDYNDQVGWLGVITLVAVAGVLLALLLYQIHSHRYLSRRFRRFINVPYAVGIFLTVGVVVWSGLAITSQNSNVQSARLDGYENVRTLINLRAQGLRVNSEESQYLIARGTIPPEEFTVEADIVAEGLRQLGGISDNSGESSLDPDDSGSLENLWVGYQGTRDEMLLLATAGERDEAIAQALGESSDAFQEFDDEIARLIDANERRFDVDMAVALSSLRFLGWVGPLLLLAGSVSIYFGIQQRAGEYR